MKVASPSGDSSAVLVGSSEIKIDRLERPHFGTGDAPNFWIDEAIWGHRLYDEQTPWLSVLECLGIAYAENRKNGTAFHESPSQRLAYTPLIQIRLRNILFNNPKLGIIAAGGNDEASWLEWEEEMRANSGGLVDPDFTYLRKHFQSFKDFEVVVRFLRSSTIEGENNKRWSSQFLFPFGPNALYEDLNVTGMSIKSDRRFFGRTGELLYLMLARGGRNGEIRAAISERFLNAELPFNRLVAAIQGEDEEGKNQRTGAYLPYRSLPEFEMLSEDWLSILNRTLPGYDALPHLVTISGLHLLLYLLRRAHAVSGDTKHLTLVIEIVSPKKSVIRDLSINSYSHNHQLPQRAIESWIDQITESEEWKRAVESSDPVPASIEVLRKAFSWDGADEVDAPATPSSLLSSLRKGAVDRHRQHLAKTHGNWGRAIGLSSKRASRKTRYAPTDSFLKTLVVCCVDSPMEFREFVELLYTRYALLIGDQQANAFTERGEADLEAFAENQSRLEERLSSLGLLQRLSDQCAYVVNPFSRRLIEGANP